MIVAGVLALVAIGLGIWAFTTKSDLDDANAQIDELNRQGSSERQAAQSEEARLQAFGEREGRRKRGGRGARVDPGAVHEGEPVTAAIP